MRKLFIILLISLAVAACADKLKDDTSDPVTPPDVITGPQNPFPADGIVSIENLITLSWTYEDADTFRVLLDTVNPPKRIERDSLIAKSLTIFAQGESTTYYWQIIALYTDSTEVAGDVWSFTTKSNSPVEPGYRMIKHFIKREPPNIVKILFQVVDLENKGVTNLTIDNFRFFEDGTGVDAFESRLQVTKRSDNLFKLNTMLMLDNSSSVSEDDPANLSAIKNIAYDFVNNMINQQEISIYKFSSQVEMVLNYTDITNRANITNAVNSIGLGARSTDLYGAVIEGSSKLVESYEEEIVQSFMVVITDGEDTQGSHTYAAAYDATIEKNVYTIGLGSAINLEVLYLLGNRGFYRIDESTSLTSVVTGIQNDITQLANSFYWLEYESPKRGNSEHSLLLYIANNEIHSILEGTYTSANFFDPTAGIYFNSKFSEPEGVTSIDLPRTGLPVEVSVSTYGGDPNAEPKYSWTTDNQLIYNALDLNYSFVEVSASSSAVAGQTISIIVTDGINGFSKTINFVIL
jgi:hypothetical protein